MKRPRASVVVPKSRWTPDATAAPAAPPVARDAGVVVKSPAADKPGGGSLAIWLIAGLLAVIAALLVGLLRKKREH
ncbi:MAG: hypothetical protein H7Y89_10990 [Steroidobacteraceae bacterium]|nr:hypothetical protein [Steroidobacteraceae bacterium]